MPLVPLVLGLLILFRRSAWRRKRGKIRWLDAVGLALLEGGFWWYSLTTRHRDYNTLSAVVEFGSLAVLIGATMSAARVRERFVAAVLVFGATASMFLLVFANTYWALGTTHNFDVKLSHLDALYVAAGTLTTAGTGDLYATSQLARGLLTLQMVLGFGLIGITAAILIGGVPRVVQRAAPTDEAGTGGHSAPGSASSAGQVP